MELAICRRELGHPTTCAQIVVHNAAYDVKEVYEVLLERRSMLLFLLSFDTSQPAADTLVAFVGSICKKLMKVFGMALQIMKTS